MYDKYYNFTSIPFLLTPDSRFFFGSSGHSRAISHLIYGLSQAEGFIVITGEVGAGKTTLVEQLWSQLDRHTYVIARVVTTQLSGNDLLRLAVSGFGVEDNIRDKATLLRRFEQTARAHHTEGRRCLLVVDEVQNLSFPALEELRMLSNITIDGQASLQTILLGQPQFRSILASPDLEQLRQRVLASYHLGPMSEAETRAYVEHRMRTVGWTGQNPYWDEHAFPAVFRATLGIPRKINTLCARILLYGALEEATTITADMVEQTAGELQQDLQASTVGASARPAMSARNGNGAHHMAEVDDGLRRRVDALEHGLSRQERAFLRLMDLVNTLGDRQR